MKKFILAATLVLGFGTAHAQEVQQVEMDPFLVDSLIETEAIPAWACNMKFSGTASGFRIVFGRYNFKGTGTMNCTRSDGKKISHPISVTMKSGFVSAGVSMGKEKLSARSGNFSLGNHKPEELFGNYYVAQGQGSVVRGVGVITGVKVGKPQLAVKFTLEFAKGTGINMSFDKFTISHAK